MPLTSGTRAGMRSATWSCVALLAIGACGGDDRSDGGAAAAGGVIAGTHLVGGTGGAGAGRGGAPGTGGTGVSGRADDDAGGPDVMGMHVDAGMPADCGNVASTLGWDAARCGDAPGDDCGASSSAASVACARCCEWKGASNYWIVPDGGAAPRTGGTFGHRVDSGHRVMLGLSEDEVHFMMLSHDDPDAAKTWQIGVGKGSQIYSIVTTYSELTGDQVTNGVWIDRVLQTVAVAGSKNTAAAPYFIHQAGTYIHPPVGVTTPFWSPMLGSEVDEAAATLHTVVWPQQAHIYADVPWRSTLLLQQHVRDVGDGVVEIVYVYTNFGEDTLDFIDFPWGGFAKTPVPVYAKSTADSGWVWATPTLWTDNHYANTEGNGWFAMLRTQAPDAMGLGIVYGKSAARSVAAETARWGPQTGEDLTVLEALPGSTIGPGDSFFMRYYLVFGRLSPDIHPRGNDLAAGHVDWGKLTFTLSQTARLDACALGSEHGLVDCAFWTLDRPVAKALPLLLLKNKSSGALVISTSPYALGPKPYLGTTTEYLAFLGWGIASTATDDPPSHGFVRLGTVITDRTRYPDPDTGVDVWIAPK